MSKPGGAGNLGQASIPSSLGYCVMGASSLGLKGSLSGIRNRL